MMIERLIQALDTLRRRWLLLLLPLLAALPVAYVYVKMSPVKYTAKSIILLQSANRGADWNAGAGGFPRQNVIEQINVIEAWLKSDYVLEDLLPQLVEGPLPTTPEEKMRELTKLRSSLTFDLIGNAVLEMRLEGSMANGLGRKLEIIVTRLLEAVLNPEEGILSAEQMILLRRSDAAKEADRNLTNAITAANLGPVHIVKSKLKAMYRSQRGMGRLSVASAEPSTGHPSGTSRMGARESDDVTSGPVVADRSRLMAQLEAERKALSTDVALVERLEKLYANHEELQTSVDSLIQKSRSSSSSYVRIFDSPERLTVIGRPRDPLIGEKSARKLAIAALMAVMLLSAGFVLLLEVLDSRLYARDDFESVAGVPVVARLPRRRRRTLWS
jgi:capsular polysaccharide biosynthesis protein